MDKVADSDSADTGSIPVRSAKKTRIKAVFFYCVYFFLMIQ